MQLQEATAARADAMVSGCGLDSASIFFCDRSRALPKLSYLHHVGISDEAQHIYLDRGVFEEDPFTRVIAQADRCGRMIHWGDRTLAGVADGAVNYRAFLDHYAVDVIGAYVQQVLPGLFLVLGAHRRRGVQRHGDVAYRLLEREIDAVSQMVVTQLLDEMLATQAGRHLLDDVLAPPAASSGLPASAGSPAALSRREREIADLVCTGKQNKQVAHLVGLSEFTVENHLRRIYRKLGVHNRAGMATRLSQRDGVRDGYTSLGAVRGAA